MSSIVILILALVAIGAAGTLVIRLLESQREAGRRDEGR
jgi:Flp pilus assembly protein CpaB